MSIKFLFKCYVVPERIKNGARLIAPLHYVKSMLLMLCNHECYKANLRALTQLILYLEPYFVAVIVASRDEDCGTCVQIGITQAKKAGVDTEILQHVIDRRTDLLSDELSEVYRFTEAVVSSTGEEDEIRESLRERYGDAGLIELSFAIAACRVFPITKRSLGYAKSCSLVDLQV